MEKRKIPAVRFKGFEDDWEQRKVGDYYEFKNGLNKGKEFFGEGTPIVNFTDVFHNRGISPEMLSGKVRLELSEIKNYEVKKGDIFFTRTSETIEEIGYPSVMLGEPENTVFSGFVLRGRCFLKDDPLDNLFKKYIFFTDAFRTEMLRKSSMTTRALTSGTAIKNMEFLHPSSKEEQHKNGELLTNLDHLITLHQRKLEKLQLVKKSMLEKMFPKNGSKIPEIRFEGFADDWEQRKLGEVIRLNGRIGFRGYTEKDIVSKDDGGVLTFSPTNIVDNKLTTNCKNTYITRFKYDESPEIKIHNGDILFVKTGSTLGKSALVTGLSEDATLNPQVVVMRTNNLNAEFLAAMLVTNTIIMQVNSAKIGGAVPTLTETRIKDFDVSIPVSEAEKEQIGKFFSQLDHLITLHQRKLEKLKSFKKSLLEKLFVQ